MIEILQIVIIMVTIFSMFLWRRAESREDQRRVESLISAMHQEMKDFPGRLCSLEARGHKPPASPKNKA